VLGRKAADTIAVEGVKDKNDERQIDKCENESGVKC